MDELQLPLQTPSQPELVGESGLAGPRPNARLVVMLLAFGLACRSAQPPPFVAPTGPDDTASTAAGAEPGTAAVVDSPPPAALEAATAADDPVPTARQSAVAVPAPPTGDDGLVHLVEVDLATSDDPTLTVIGNSEGSAETVPQTLVGAALAERARRRDALPPRVVINDKNLASLASQGTLTEDTTAAAKPAASAATIGGTGSSSPRALIESEATWRSRGRALRVAWADAARQVRDLQAEAARLRTSFYAEDDPFVRDGQIKPAWDRVLDQLAQARERVARSEELMDAFLEEGRQAGALPGWLREGSELEPQRRVEAPPRSPAPSEPTIANEDQD